MEASGPRDGYALQAGGHVGGRCEKMLKHGGRVDGFAVLEGGRLVSGGRGTLFRGILSAGDHGYFNALLRVWDPAKGVNVATLGGKGFKIAALPGGRFAAAGRDTKTAAVWGPASDAHPICEYTGHTDYVYCVASLLDNLVASGSSDKTVHIWKADKGAHVVTLKGHEGGVRALAVLSDGRLASGSSDHTVRLWNISNPASAHRVLQHGNIVYALAVLDGGILASGCWDNKVYLWDVRSTNAEPMALLEGHMDGVLSLAALPRGLLASGSADQTVHVWNVVARTCVAVLQGHTGGVGALTALPGERLASGSTDENDVIRVWDVAGLSAASPTSPAAMGSPCPSCHIPTLPCAAFSHCIFCLHLHPAPAAAVGGGGGGEVLLFLPPTHCRSPPLLGVVHRGCCKAPLPLASPLRIGHYPLRPPFPPRWRRQRRRQRGVEMHPTVTA